MKIEGKMFQITLETREVEVWHPTPTLTSEKERAPVQGKLL